ncbi:MAG: hypothetical protein VKJ04_06665 [Vampirovibrionales bacterium]|nr:hypothetical protein [Vampirovibrionales bacterium]
MFQTFQSSKTSNVGLSISPQAIEVAVFSPKTNAIVESLSVKTPVGMMDINGDRLQNPQLLKDSLSILLKQLKGKVTSVNLTLPGSLLRMVEMPKMAPEQLYVSLSSEAERYKTFDNTDAIVDFAVVENELQPVGAGKMNVVFAALRQDALENYLAIFKSLRVKIAKISLEPVDILRGMAGTGLLDSLVEQIGPEQFWGSIFVEPERVRISLWQASNLVEFRETNINTADFELASVDSLTVSDMVEEIRRTTKLAMPRVWLTYGMHANMQYILSDLLATPVKSADQGSALAMDNPALRLPTIGAALQSVIPYPFPLNLLKGMAGMTPKSSGGAALSESGVGDDNSSPLIPIAGVCVVIAMLLSGALWLGATSLAGTVESLQVKANEKKATVAQLTAEKDDLQAKVSVYQQLKAALDEARIRNRVYVALSDDLQRKSPRRLWVQDIHVGGAGDKGKAYEGKIAFEGKALQYEDVIRFARSFDRVPYLGDFAIEQIKEQRLLGVPLFNYKMQGKLKLDQSLLPSSNEKTMLENPAQSKTKLLKPNTSHQHLM